VPGELERSAGRAQARGWLAAAAAAFLQRSVVFVLTASSHPTLPLIELRIPAVMWITAFVALRPLPRSESEAIKVCRAKKKEPTSNDQPSYSRPAQRPSDHPRNAAFVLIDCQPLEDIEFLQAVRATGRRKLIPCALWTEVCVAFPALDALREGSEVYPVVDAIGGTSLDAHRAALERVVQAGAQLISWVSLARELQRDWARMETVPAIVEIVLTERLTRE
jgi:hypothetical protein